MITPDQILAAAPDAASLKAGRGLATPRKWESAGGDDEVLWGLAMGSGKEPYQTRVSLADLASKCSCPSRKFPCKHAIGLMFLAIGEPAALTQKERPAWVAEWLEARSAREQKALARAEEKEAKPVDEKAAGKRRAQREGRIEEGVALLQQTLLDLTREGLAGAAARDAGVWENLARRMVDAQAPGLAGTLRHLVDTVLRDPAVDRELPLELGRLYLLLQAWTRSSEADDPLLSAELQAQFGLRAAPGGESPALETIADDWLVAGRRVEERDRLITSVSWLRGQTSGRWARVLRFAPVPQTIAEPWPVGATVKAALSFSPGLYPLRAQAADAGQVLSLEPPREPADDLEALLDRFAGALAANPFLRALPFLISLCPAENRRHLVDPAGRALPWQATEEIMLRVECICGGRPQPMCGEWDGRFLRLLALRDGAAWIPLVPQQP